VSPPFSENPRSRKRVNSRLAGSGFLKYFPEALSCGTNTHQFHAGSLPNNDISPEEEENYVDIVSDSSLRTQFHKKSYIEFWMGNGTGFTHDIRKVLNISFISRHSTCSRLGYQQWQPPE
jgi:hypothetical protein